MSEALPTPTTDEKKPAWYQTTGGKVGIGVASVAAVGAGYGVVRARRARPAGNPGGYSYFTPAHRNPAAGSTALAVIATVLGTGAVAWGVGKVAQKRMDEARKEEEAKKPAGEHALTKVYADTATLGASSQLMDEVALPVTFAALGSPAVMARDFPFVTVPPALLARSSQGDRIPLERLFVEADGEVQMQVLPAFGEQLDDQQLATVMEEITFTDGTQEGAFHQVARVITDLTGPAAYAAWRTALDMITAKPTIDLQYQGADVPAFVEAAAARIAAEQNLAKLPLAPTADGDLPADRVRRGIQLVGQLAWQTWHVEQAAFNA